MTMLENESSILVYGLNEDELNKFHDTGKKIIIVNNYMIKTKIKDIVSGFRFKIVSKTNIKEKIVLFNNLSDMELSLFISITKSIVDNPILAVVTPNSREWEFEKLAKHLIEEREWHRKRERGRY